MLYIQVMSTAHYDVSPGVDEGQNETPLYQRIRTHIRRQIERGAYSADGRLPSEPTLASQFSTTRMTVRHALRQLEEEGLVQRRPGKGTFVGRGPIDTPVVQTRLLSFEEQISEIGGSVTYQLLGFSHVAADDKAADRLRVNVGSSLYRVERLRLLNGLVFCLEDRLIVGDIGGSITLDALQKYSVHHIIQVLLGISMAKNDVLIRASVASARLSKLLAIKRGAPLLVREHKISGSNGNPIVYGEAIYRAEFRFSYTVDPHHPADPLRFVSDEKLL